MGVLRYCSLIFSILFFQNTLLGQATPPEPLLAYIKKEQSVSISDSLRQLIEQPRGSRIKTINALNAYAKLHLQYAPDTSLIYAQQALELAQNQSYFRGMAESKHYIGQVLLDHGAFSQSILHYADALQYYKKAGLIEGEAEVYNALGDLYYFTRQIEEALEQHQKAYHIYKSNGLKRGEAITLGFIGHYYEKQENYEQALNYQIQALEIYKELQDLEGLSTIYGNLGSIYEDLEDYEKALTYFQQALAVNEQTNDEQERIVHLNNIGDTYRKRGMLKEGLAYTQRSLELAQKLDQKYQIESALKDLSKTYVLLEDYPKALETLNEAYELYGELYDEESAEQVTRMQTLHEMSEKEKEIEILNREKYIVLLTRNAFMGGLIMLFLLAAIIFSRQRLKNRKDRELYATQQELIHKELENAQLSERQLKIELESKASQLTSHALNIIQKNKMLKELKTKLNHLRQNNKGLDAQVNQLIKKIDYSFNFDEDWKDFKDIFEQVHPNFYHKLNEKFPNLTAAEIRLCALLKLNLDSKDMATILGISQDSLRVTRYRLRRKLNMQKGANLTTFIMNI